MNKKANDFLHLSEMTVQRSVLTDNVKRHIDSRKCSPKFIFYVPSQALPSMETNSVSTTHINMGKSIYTLNHK